MPLGFVYTATSRIGVTVAESADPSLERRGWCKMQCDFFQNYLFNLIFFFFKYLVSCCSGYITETREARNCTKMGGECCAREFTDYPGAGGMGLSMFGLKSDQILSSFCKKIKKRQFTFNPFDNILLLTL